MLQIALHPLGPLYHFGTFFFTPNSVPEKFKGYLAIQYGTFLLKKYYPFLVTKTLDRGALRRLALKKKSLIFFLPA